MYLFMFSPRAKKKSLIRELKKYSEGESHYFMISNIILKEVVCIGSSTWVPLGFHPRGRLFVQGNFPHYLRLLGAKEKVMESKMFIYSLISQLSRETDVDKIEVRAKFIGQCLDDLPLCERGELERQFIDVLNVVRP